MALTDARRSVLTLMIVNAHPEASIPLTIRLGSWPLPRQIAGRRLSGPSLMARNTVEATDRIALGELKVEAKAEDGAVVHTLPPHSVTELVFRKKS